MANRKRGIVVSDNIVHVSDDEFEAQVLKADTPVLVDFWASWCGPCKMIEPIVHDIADAYADRLKVAKVNIEENQVTPSRYGVRGIPTLMLFNNGDVQDTKVGAVAKAQLEAFIESNL